MRLCLRPTLEVEHGEEMARVKTIKSSVKPSVMYPSLSNKGAVAVQNLRIYLETVAVVTTGSRVTHA